MRCRFCCLGWGLVCVLLAAPALADTLDEIEKKLVESNAKLKSYSAKTTMSQDMSFGEGMQMKSNSTGTVEWARRDGKEMFRTDLSGSQTQIMGEQKMESQQTTTMICDGDYFYTLSDQGGQKHAMKQKAEQNMSFDAKSMMQMLRDDYHLEAKGDEKVDGHDCAVIEARPKDPQNNPVTRQLLYFMKETGINLKLVCFDAGGKTVLTTGLSDVKLNTEIPADRFVFKAPEGVEVMDLSQMGGMGGHDEHDGHDHSGHDHK